jgi:DNA polymerase III psi subunit
MTQIDLLQQDDKLISLIKSNFNESDMNIFELNYKFYIANKNNLNDFLVDFDEVWRWIGFSTKQKAKDLLLKEFEINIDYKMNTIKLNCEVKQNRIEKRGGTNKEIILLTIECFKIFCLTAATVQSKKIYRYYIKMENIITKYMENKQLEIITENNNNKQLLQIKDQEIEKNKKLLNDTLNKLQLKDQEVDSFKNKKYEEIEKDKNVYIFSCDKSNIYKIGKSKDVIARKKQLQTGNVDDIIIHHTRPTSNDYLLEQIVHYVLDSYRCKSNGEHFTANLEYTKIVIDIAEVFLDTLKSTYEHISNDELLQKINENILNLSKNVNQTLLINNKDDNFENKTDKEVLIDLLGLNKDNLSNFEYELVSDDKKLEKHFHFKIFLNNSVDLFNSKTKFFNETIKNKYTKIKMCKKLMEVLNISNINNLNKNVTENFHLILDNDWLNNNIKSIKKMFDIRTNKYDNFVYYNIYLLLITILKNLFDVNLFICKRIKNNVICYYYYILNNDIFNKHKLLIDTVNK